MVRGDMKAVFENGLGTAYRRFDVSNTRLRRVHPLSCRAVDRFVFPQLARLLPRGMSEFEVVTRSF